MSKNEVLVTEDLTKKFSDFTALNKLNLKIFENSCTGYLGPNGSGKSTTIKILTGLIRPTTGRAYILGFEVPKNTREALLDVGVVVETPEFPPYLTPIEVLSYFGKIRGMSRQNILERSKEVLDLVNMREWGTKKIGKFSKGMKQRVAIATSLVHDPSLLILDEPTSGLDPRGIIEVREIIKSLKKIGKTIFMSSHLLGETKEVCDKVALLDKGNLLKYVTVSDVEKISKNFRIEIEFTESPTQSQLTSVLKIMDIKNVKQKSEHIIIVEFEGGLEQRAELLKQIQNLALKVITFRTIDYDLEALYLDLVSESVR